VLYFLSPYPKRFSSTREKVSRSSIKRKFRELFLAVFPESFFVIAQKRRKSERERDFHKKLQFEFYSSLINN
jgi:hypothetical protein